MATQPSGSETGPESEVAVRGRTTRSSQLFVCAECRYAQLFAVQPRALCTRPGVPFEGAVLFAGQPACALLVPRTSVEPVLARCSSGRQANEAGLRAGAESSHAEE